MSLSFIWNPAISQARNGNWNLVQSGYNTVEPSYMSSY